MRRPLIIAIAVALVLLVGGVVVLLPDSTPGAQQASAQTEAAAPAALVPPTPTAAPASEPAASAAAEPESVVVLQQANVGPALTFATFNVCKTLCAPPAPSWDVRRDRVARVIGESDADVVGLQEATNNPTSFTKTQAEDIANLVAPAGYRTPSYPLEANECRRPRDAAGQLAGPSPCDNTAMLIFKDATVEQVTLPGNQPSAGILLSTSIAPGQDPLSGMRSVAWAYLAGRNGTGPFLAISMHTDSAKTPEAEASRVAVAGALNGWAQAWNAAHGMAGVPVVLMADLNSFQKRQPNGAQTVLVNAGWTDAASTPSARNKNFSTINYSADASTDAQGFPSRPKEYRATKKNPEGDATRIDYIMVSGAEVRPVDYEVVVHLTADGSFDPDYQASDHQMVRSTWSFPG